MSITRSLLLAALLGAATAPVYAQTDDSRLLDTVTVVSSHRHPGSLAFTHQIDAPGIALANVQTTADLLATDGLLTLQKSQQGGGSPVIRGFEASRVLIVVDGVPLNNLIYRSGHLQNVITVDQCMLSRAGILFGPSSVMYGSGALGGVVVFDTKDPVFAPADSPRLATHGSAFVRYGSANNEVTGHVDLSLGGSRLASLTSFTYSRFGDLRSGRAKNPFMPAGDSYIYRPWTVERQGDFDILVPNTRWWVQAGSGYDQYDVLQKLVFRPNEAWTHKLDFQLSNSSDVPRYDRLTDRKGDDPKFAEWYYGPQLRILAAYQAKARGRLAADSASLTLYYQNVRESRHNRKFDNAWRTNRHERVNVAGFTADWMRALGQGRLHAGLDGALSYLRSTAWSLNIEDGRVKPLDTRYPDGANRMHNIDLFGAYTLPIGSRLTLDAGLRAGYSYLYADFRSREFFAFLESDVKSVTQRNFTYSANVGLNYRPAAAQTLGLVLSTGYYVPNIDDVGKVFDSQPGMVVVPNPHIKPEQALNLEIDYAGSAAGRFDWQLALFGTSLFNAITLMPSELNGQQTVTYDGEPSRVYACANHKRALLAGVTASLRWRPVDALEASATATYTYGQITRSYVEAGSNDGASDGTGPLDHVPPLFGRVGVSYTLRGRWIFEAYSLFNGHKPLSRYNLTGEDNIVYATTLGADGRGLPAWFTLNLKATLPLTPHFTLQLGLDNILDTAYRTFGSGINAPGRSLIATLRATL